MVGVVGSGCSVGGGGGGGGLAPGGGGGGGGGGLAPAGVDAGRAGSTGSSEHARPSSSAGPAGPSSPKGSARFITYADWASCCQWKSSQVGVWGTGGEVGSGPAGDSG